MKLWLCKFMKSFCAVMAIALRNHSKCYHSLYHFMLGLHYLVIILFGVICVCVFHQFMKCVVNEIVVTARM